MIGEKYEYFIFNCRELYPSIHDSFIFSLSTLYNTNICDYLYATSSHTYLEIKDLINRLGLGNESERSKFSVLYKHYFSQTKRITNKNTSK